ncbi:embryogenesis-like protein [Lycium ferocissimum]|uniref:embryogenesis-like protein n=1 Tax=Lycium ferocissimum TaxID=112874 RepID=UPI0028167DDE|nr:embryogenesis-like protein [Lycium ferocissimum]
MHRRSSISLCKSLFKHPFEKSTIPKSSFPSRSLTSLSNQHISNHFTSLILTKTTHFLAPTRSNSSTQFVIFKNVRQYSIDTDREVDKINLKFAEAREEIESAMESKETVYFDEEAECARAAVKEVLDLYNGLLEKMSESEKGVIQRSMGLKLEQLKAELDQLNE